MTYCLAHDAEGKPNGCCLANECPAHLALWFVHPSPDAETVGRICGEYPAVVPAESAA